MVRSLLALACIAAICTTSAPADAKKAGKLKWKVHQSEKFGLQMEIPDTMKFSATTDGEWGGLKGKGDDAELYVLARLNKFPEPEGMLTFARNMMKIPTNKFQLVEEKKNDRGWTWRNTYREIKGKTVYFVIVGHGPKGAYMMYLKATWASRIVNHEAYARWYKSVKLS